MTLLRLTRRVPSLHPIAPFRYTLQVANASMNCGLQTVFRRYDKSGEGYLDASEFTRACEDMGFGAIAHELFLEFDDDLSGFISYGEVGSLLTFCPILTLLWSPILTLL